MTKLPFRGCSRRARASAPTANLIRAARSRLYGVLAPAWTGTKRSLKRAVARTLKPYLKNLTLLARILRDARFAALLACAAVAGIAPPVFASPPIELSSIAAGTGGFVINGEAAGDKLGYFVSAAGDVNGDGLADLFVGLLGDDPERADSGRSYLIFGKSDSAAVEISDLVAGNGGFALIPEAPNHDAWYSFARAGDVNGDGLDDLLVGASGMNVNESNSGRSYVIFGKADSGTVILADIAAGLGGFAVNGEGRSDHSGTSVSAADDVNGDGLADVLIGAPGANISSFYAGRSYVVFGKADSSAVELSSISSGMGGFAIDGQRVSGLSVSGAGDVNGDGLADVIVGAPLDGPDGAFRSDAEIGPPPRRPTGCAYIVFGKTGPELVQLRADIAATIGYRMGGFRGRELFGSHVSAAGDINGDGFSDVAASVLQPDWGTAYEGRSEVWFGPPFAGTLEVRGEQAGDQAGAARPAGDMNGDGFGDLAIGAPGFDANGSQSGRCYVVLGRQGSAHFGLGTVADGTNGFALDGAAAGDQASKIHGVGDVNGDGIADLLIGAPNADPNGPDSGQCYVVFSPGGAPAPSAAYYARSRSGDGPGGAPVVPTVVPNYLNDARVKIDFSDDDFGAGGGLNGSSLESVTLARTNAAITNLSTSGEVANVMWEISTDRAGWVSAELTFKYTGAEVYGLDESSLKIFQAPAPSGPWTELSTTRAPQRNEVRATVTTFGFFALEGDPPNAVAPDLFDRYE